MICQNTAKMFADDTKLYAKIKSRDDCHCLQHDLNQLAAWSRNGRLGFNETMCGVLKIRENLKYADTLHRYNLQQASTQKDLGVLISNNLNPSSHIQYIVKKDNQRISIIKHCFTGLTQKSPYTLQDRSANLTSPPLTLQKLADRRWQTDMCEVYKYMHYSCKSNPCGHLLKLENKFCCITLCQQYFSNQVMNDWSSTTWEVISAPSMQCFKQRLRFLQTGKER